MATHKLLLLPGDGIGQEVMAEVRRVVAWFDQRGLAHFEIEEDLVGGSAHDAHGKAISEEAMAKAHAADAPASDGTELRPSTSGPVDDPRRPGHRPPRTRLARLRSSLP